MAQAVVSAVSGTLGNLLIQEGRFLRGVRDQVEELQIEFRRIQSFLKDAEQKQHDSDTIRNWIQEIRRLAYRADDVLEEYVVKVGSRNGKGFVHILKRLVCFAIEIGNLHNLGSEIERIKSQIHNLSGQMDQSGILAIITRDQEETSDEDRRRFIRKTYAHEEPEYFVGMEGDIKTLVSLLVSHQETSHQVIGVWGMGGSGKTTVVRKVYKHVDVKGFFNSFAWVCITQKCKIKSVMQDIFQQLLPTKSKSDTTDEMVEQIYKAQMEKKCLIVLDDIWKLDDWKCLSKCFPKVGSHSKVLLTTRIGNVAEIGYPVKLKGFTEDDAWKLLHMKAFNKTHLEGSEYEKLGRKMIRRCDCLSLAVAVIGGMLSGKNSLREWKLVSENVNSYIGRGEGTGGQGEVEKVLVLSYDELPYHLKPCFLSLAFLQEDQHVFTEKIYDLWMAQGLIQSKHVGSGESMRDVAKCYLNELKFRCMVQLDDVVGLSLHDSMLDLCRSKAKEEEFLHVVDKRCISEKAYRLVVQVSGDANDFDFFKAVESNIPLRSLEVIHRDFKNFILPEKIFNLPQFKSLRTLIIRFCYLRRKCFHGIETLIHLRLLILRKCKWERFSLEWVDKLSFLQTLDVTFAKLSLMKLPPVETFCKMQQLKHLYLPSFTDEVRIQGKLRLMNLPQLEILDNLHSRFYDLEDLIHLQKLRTLQACTITDDESLVQITFYICRSNLRWISIQIQKCNLDGQLGSDSLQKLLKIPNVTLHLGIRSCKLLKMPRLDAVDFSKMCPGLVSLSLQRTNTAEDIMQPLGKFPNLEKLNLSFIQFGGEEMICVAGSFPRLKKLGIFVVRGKYELRIDEAAMPNLSSMKIVCCSGINVMIPERLRSFACIEKCSSRAVHHSKS